MIYGHDIYPEFRGSQGAKWLASEVTGFTPFAGTAYYVKPGTGSITGDGLSPASAFKTLTQAKAVAVFGDVVYLIAESNTASATTDYQSTVLDWSTNGVSLIGINAGSMIGQRSRIAALSTATGVTDVIKVSASNCFIAGIEVYGGISGDATSLGAMEVTGTRNLFYNCQISGMGTTDSVTTSGHSLKLSGAEENLFKNCVIGLDTIDRDNTTQGEIWFNTTNTRNQFEDCIIQGYISNASYYHVTFTGATSIDRWQNFVRCMFISESTNDATAQTQIFGSMDALTKGYINIKDCAAFTPGATTAVWIDTGTNRLKVSNGPLPVKTGGEAVIVN